MDCDDMQEIRPNITITPKYMTVTMNYDFVKNIVERRSLNLVNIWGDFDGRLQVQVVYKLNA